MGRALTILAQSWAMIFTLLLALAVVNKLCREIETLSLKSLSEETMKKTPP